MKNLYKVLGIISMALVIGFSFTACDDGSTGGGGGGGGGSRTVTYSGTAGSGSYSLKIIENKNNPNRAVLNDPLPGDNFEFTWTDSANTTKKSAGQVASVSGNEFTMLPANAETKETTFTTTVSDEGLTAMSGTFTWTDGTTSTGSGTLTPSGATPGAGGGGKLTVQNLSVISEAIVYGYSGPVTNYEQTILAQGSFIAVTQGEASPSPVQLYKPTVTTPVPFSQSGTFCVQVKDGNGNTRFFSQVRFTNGNAAINWNSPSYIYDGQPTNPGGGTGVWTPVPNTTFVSNINAIAYGGGKFVAGGADGRMAYSSDGVTWTKVANSTFGASNNEINAIAYGGNKFVAGGEDGKMAYSSDGVTWTAIPAGTGAGQSKFDGIGDINAIVYGNGTFVAGGDFGDMAYSTDGVTWTKVAQSGLSTIHAIAYGGGKFVAVANGAVGTSTDGVTWTKVTNSTFGNRSWINATIAYGNGKFVAGGSTLDSGNGPMAYSSDGVTWTVINTNTAPFTNMNETLWVNAIAYGNNKFVVGDYTHQTLYSTDGVTWTIATGEPYMEIFAIAYGGNKFVAVGRNGRIAYSTGL